MSLCLPVWFTHFVYVYAVNQDASARRSELAKKLLEFVRRAEQELAWLREQEAREVNRDWNKSDQLNADEIRTCAQVNIIYLKYSLFSCLYVHIWFTPNTFHQDYLNMVTYLFNLLWLASGKDKPASWMSLVLAVANQIQFSLAIPVHSTKAESICLRKGNPAWLLVVLLFVSDALLVKPLPLRCWLKLKQVLGDVSGRRAIWKLFVISSLENLFL